MDPPQAHNGQTLDAPWLLSVSRQRVVGRRVMASGQASLRSAAATCSSSG